jgi:CheY-like chemotaxis protein
MDGIERPIWFLGDLDDSWVLSILAATADSSLVRVIPCSGELPECLYEPDRPPRILILHRSRLTSADASRLERWRLGPRTNPLPRIILCFNPYARYAELERCLRAADLVVPEATAVETLSRHVTRLMADAPEALGQACPEAPLVEVVSSDHELRAILAESLMTAGFQVTAARELHDDRDRLAISASGPVMTLWDVPVLDPDWPQRLEHRCKLGPVVVLLGFADRAMVAEARSRGALACLDVPFDLHDLIDVLNRVGRSVRSDRSLSVSGRSEPAHLVPPPPASRASRGRAAILERESRA